MARAGGGLGDSDSVGLPTGGELAVWEGTEENAIFGNPRMRMAIGTWIVVVICVGRGRCNAETYADLGRPSFA